MPATTWTLTLQDRAAASARRINRDVTALNASLRMLGQIAPSAQASLSRVAPAGTAGQIRGATAAIKEQTKALRELHKVANPTATPRPGRASGRGASGSGGRTRVEGRFGEMFTPRQSERLRGMGDANQRRWDRQRQQRDAAGSRSRLRDQQRETRESQNHYRGIFQSQQRAAAWGRQQNARAASTNARARAQARRDMTERSEMSSAMLGRAAGLAGMLGGIAASIVGTVVGIGTAFAYSLVAVFLPAIFPPEMRDHHGLVGVYFEAAAVITALVLLGQVLELRARAATSGAIRAHRYTGTHTNTGHPVKSF